MWGGVNDDQFSPAIGRGLQTLGQASMWKRNYNRSLTLSAITPTGGACLGIEVDNRGWKPGCFNGRGDVQGESGFSSPTFLADNGDCFHIASIAAKIIYSKMRCRYAALPAKRQRLITTAEGCVENVVEIAEQRAPSMWHWVQSGGEVKSHRLERLSKGFPAVDLAHLYLP